MVEAIGFIFVLGNLCYIARSDWTEYRIPNGSILCLFFGFFFLSFLDFYIEPQQRILPFESIVTFPKDKKEYFFLIVETSFLLFLFLSISLFLRGKIGNGDIKFIVVTTLYLGERRFDWIFIMFVMAGFVSMFLLFKKMIEDVWRRAVQHKKTKGSIGIPIKGLPMAPFGLLAFLYLNMHL